MQFVPSKNKSALIKAEGSPALSHDFSSHSLNHDGVEEEVDKGLENRKQTSGSINSASCHD